MRTPTAGLIVALACSLVLVASPRAQTAPPTVVGKWTLVVDLQSPDSTTTLEIKLDGKKVSGTITGTGVFLITGEYADGKLTFSMDYNGQTTVVFTGALKDDGTMAGTMDYGQGPIAWRAQRTNDTNHG